MKSNSPPRSKARKLPLEYVALIGMTHTCDTCHETKAIDPTGRNFAPTKEGPGSTCRKCVGRASRQKFVEATGKHRLEKGEKLECPKQPDNWANPFAKGTRAKPYWDRVEELTERLYELGAAGTRKKRELDEVRAELNKVTRCFGDPAGGGQLPNTDEGRDIAFRTFAYILSRLIKDWVNFGEIHDVDILPALLSEEPQTLLLASRNSGKSACVEILAAWWLHRDPLDIIGVVSGKSRRAKRTLRTVRLFIDQCPLLWHLKPDDECLDSADQFVTPQANGKLGSSVSFSSFGIQASVTGYRWNKVILDDIETKDAKSVVVSENLADLVSDVWNVLNPGGRIKALGTPQIAGSIYAKWATSEEWTVTRALLFEESEVEGRKKTELRSRWVERWSDEELQAKRRKLPPREWDLHWRINLELLADEGKPIHLRDFITVDWDASKALFPTIVKPHGKALALDTGPAHDPTDRFIGPSEVSADSSRYIATCAAVDPASGMVGNDECGVSIVSVTSQGLAVVRCVAGVRGRNVQETMTKAAALIHSFFPSKIVCEARAADLFPAQLASVLARRGYGCMVEPVMSGSRKGDRICDAITTLTSDNRVVLLESVVTGADANETIKQLTHVTPDGRSLRNDDRADSLAWALSALAPMLLADPADTVQTIAEADLERLLSMPLRKGGIREDGIEMAMLETSEAEERARLKLEHALSVQAQELRDFGAVDPRFQKYIELLQAEVAKFPRRPAITVN